MSNNDRETSRFAATNRDRKGVVNSKERARMPLAFTTEFATDLRLFSLSAGGRERNRESRGNS